MIISHSFLKISNKLNLVDVEFVEPKEEEDEGDDIANQIRSDCQVFSVLSRLLSDVITTVSDDHRYVIRLCQQLGSKPDHNNKWDF